MKGTHGGGGSASGAIPGTFRLGPGLTTLGGGFREPRDSIGGAPLYTARSLRQESPSSDWKPPSLSPDITTPLQAVRGLINPAPAAVTA